MPSTTMRRVTAPLAAPAKHGRVYRMVRAIDVFGAALLLDAPEPDDSLTMSFQSATRKRAGAGWACMFCALLGVLVARHHCRDTLDGAPMTRLALTRAGSFLVAGFLLSCEAVSQILHALWRLGAIF